MSRREGVSAIVDISESVKQLENELRILTTNKQALSVSVSELTGKRDSLLKEILELESKVKKVLDVANSESDRIIGIANEKAKKANIKESELADKQTDLDNKIKASENIIKSNEGLKKNLDLMTLATKNKLIKINDFVELLKTKLKDI